MKRAYLIELTIFRDYGRQLLALGFLVAVLVGCGMQTVLAAPSIITCMFFMMGAMGAAAYDEQNDWGRFRLTLPLSRRDVVLGRYGAIVTLGLGGMAVGLLAAFAISAVASAVELPGELSQALALDADMLSGMAFATTFCLLIGAVGFVSTLWISDPYLIGISYALMGCAWAAMLAMPFTILTNALNGEHIGTYLGLFNCTICLPQIVAALLGGLILGLFPVSANGAPDTVWMLGCAGVLLLLGSLAVWNIRETFGSKEAA